MPKIKPEKIIVIVGPTASGKSDLGIKLALRLSSGQAKKLYGINGAEIISADSRQVYRGMDIGTGKVNKKEQKMAKHYLIDVTSPKKRFTADDFKKLGEKSIKNIFAENKIPIIAGGTGFYIDILLGRAELVEVPPNLRLRKQLDKKTAEELYTRLKNLDPKRAKNIDRHNKRRLIRALEIIAKTGKPVPRYKLKAAGGEPRQRRDSRYKLLWLGINPGKEKLSKKIKERLDKRLKQGMLKEVEKLHNEGLSWKRLDELGLEYRYISRWLREKKKQSEINRFKDSEQYLTLLQEIIKYSKRQMTWFKRNKDINWIGSTEEADKLSEKFLS